MGIGGRWRLRASAIVACAFSAAVAAAQVPVFASLDQPIPPGSGPVQAAADLDGDGDADLLCRDNVLSNDGNGRFSALASNPLPFLHWRVALADLNNDGLTDVVSIVNGALRIDLNASGFVFMGPHPGAPVLPAVPSVGFPAQLATGDVDLDGDVDLLVGTATFGWPAPIPAAAVVCLNDLGTLGVFTAAPGVFPSALISASPMILRDLDADGDLDAIVGTSLAANAGGIFTLITAPWPNAPEVGDYNGDGRPDVACIVAVGGGSGIGVFMGSPLGFLPPVTTSLAAPGFPSVLAAVDVSGDGRDDLVIQDYPIGLSTRIVTPGGTFGSATQIWPDLALIGVPGNPLNQEPPVIRDLDGDSDRDVVAVGWADPVALMNAGNGILVTLGGRTGGFMATNEQRVADLDGDGDPDIVAFTGATVGTALNDGEGHFTPGPSLAFNFPGGPYAYLLHPFDRDGDGDADLFVGRQAGSGLSTGAVDHLYDNAGGGNFVQIATLTIPAGTTAARSADLDGDGDQDLVLARQSLPQWGNGSMDVLFSLGAAGMSQPFPIGGIHRTFDLELADFDGNGTIDAFQTNAAAPGAPPDPCVVYLNMGTSFVTVVQTGISGSISAAGDLNGDGLADLVIDGQVHYNAGGGSFTLGPLLVSALVAPAELFDVDQDGDLDLVEAPGTLMRNAGGGTFLPPESYLPRPVNPAVLFNAREASLTDVDRDGDADLVTFGEPNSTGWFPGGFVLMNRTRQLATGIIPRPGRPASIDLYGTPAGSWQLYVSAGTASIAVPPLGTVLIDPPSAQLFATGSFAPPASTIAGTSALLATVPNVPGLIGWTTYWQALDVASLRLTNRLTVTVLGF